MAVAGRSFDIVDIPDFVTFGGVLKAAFSNRGVRIGRLVLAMHGNISDTIELNWREAGDALELNFDASRDHTYEHRFLRACTIQRS